MIKDIVFLDVFEKKDLKNKSLDDILKETFDDLKTKHNEDFNELKLPLKSFKVGIFIIAEDYELRESSD